MLHGRGGTLGSLKSHDRGAAHVCSSLPLWSWAGCCKSTGHLSNLEIFRGNSPLRYGEPANIKNTSRLPNHLQHVHRGKKKRHLHSESNETSFSVPDHFLKWQCFLQCHLHPQLASIAALDLLGRVRRGKQRNRLLLPHRQKSEWELKNITVGFLAQNSAYYGVGSKSWTAANKRTTESTKREREQKTKQHCSIKTNSEMKTLAACISLCHKKKKAKQNQKGNNHNFVFTHRCKLVKTGCLEQRACNISDQRQKTLLTPAFAKQAWLQWAVTKQNQSQRSTTLIN